MFGNAVSNVSFRFLEGVSAGHHDISHHQKDADKLRSISSSTGGTSSSTPTCCVSCDSMKEGDSTVLEQLDDPVLLRR